jgi:hypothetical protein
LLDDSSMTRFGLVSLGKQVSQGVLVGSGVCWWIRNGGHGKEKIVVSFRTRAREAAVESGKDLFVVHNKQSDSS